jgi:hypothetical protein
MGVGPGRVSQALRRVPAIASPSNTRGKSRVQESCTYASVRGALDRGVPSSERGESTIWFASSSAASLIGENRLVTRSSALLRQRAIEHLD